MKFDLNSDQRMLKESILDCAKGLDRSQPFITNWKKIAQTGIIGLAVDSDFGGSNLGAVDYLMAFEALATGCNDNGLSFAVAAHTLSCVIPIDKYGANDLKEKYLNDLISGKAIAANAMTESNSGSDVFNVECIAEKFENGYKINGIKTFISNSSVASLALVYAATNKNKGFFGGISAFVVEKSNYKLGAEFEKMGLESCSLGEILFNDSEVPSESMLGKEGAGAVIFNESMVWERICLAGIHIGAMQRILTKTIDFVKNRQSNGQNLGKFQAISHTLAEMQMNLEVARTYAYKVAFMLDSFENVSKEAAITKLFVSSTVKQFMASAMQIFGGYGYIKDYGIEQEVRDAMASTIYSGTSEIQKNIIASNLGI